jgi:ubiquinone/menaquinone biosynthesis C-methylase UbiE
MTTAVTEGHVLHWARLYDWGTRLFGRPVRALHRRVIDRANITPGTRVLDVGCGPGRLALAAAQRAGPTGETLGIDPSPEMVALATRNAARAGSSAQFRVATIEALPAANDHFDVVLATLMLHHLTPDLQRRGLAEIRRILRSGGRFVAADFGATPGHGLGHLLSVLGVRRGSEHAQYLASIIADAGLERIEIEPTESRAFCIILARKP